MDLAAMCGTLATVENGVSITRVWVPDGHFHDEVRHNLLNGLRQELGNSIQASEGSLSLMLITPIFQWSCCPLPKYLTVPLLSGQSLTLSYPILSICVGQYNRSSRVAVHWGL